METVKFVQTKVKVGDCVSVPNSYFGTKYQQALTVVLLTRRYSSHVTKVVDGKAPTLQSQMRFGWRNSDCLSIRFSI